MAADVWTAGDRYEPYMGRWSRRMAEEFLPWLAPRPGGDWLDVGCGTGALTEVVTRLARPPSVVAVGPSPALLRHARRRVPEAVDLRLGEAGALPLGSASVDYVVSGLVGLLRPDADDPGLLGCRRLVGSRGAGVRRGHASPAVSP